MLLFKRKKKQIFRTRLAQAQVIRVIQEQAESAQAPAPAPAPAAQQESFRKKT